MSIQTVILAAGMGTRLGRSLPKSLTELNDGRSIMQQQHDNIRAAFGADARITTVVGYRAETIIEAFPTANYVHNERYDVTNTSKSLLRALNATGKSGVLWMNGDVVFDPRILGRAIEFIERERGESKMSKDIVTEALIRTTLWGAEHRAKQVRSLALDAKQKAEPAVREAAERARQLQKNRKV